jgi:outer membrane protein assembly factor BamD
MKKILILLLSLLLSSCFNNTTEEQYSSWSPKTLFETAKSEISKGSFKKGIEIYEELQANYPNSKYAEQSKLNLAYAFYKKKDYDQAIYILKEFIKLYPKHKVTPYAYYMLGVVAQSKSSSTLEKYIDTGDKGQKSTKTIEEAFGYYLDLIEKFPETKYAKDAKNKLILLKNILARHELFVAIFYTKNGANIGAIYRTKYIIEKYPNTPSVPAAIHLMAYNYDIIGEKKLAKDTRRVLKKSYPLYTPHYSLED